MQLNLFANQRISPKLIVKATVSFAIAAMFITAALANPKGAERRLSFQGYLQGHETDVLQGTPPEAISVDGNLTGIATHLTQFALTYKVTVKLPEGSSTGTAELIAANGDRIFSSIVGQGELTDTETPNLNSIVEINLITGGTGQFAGAGGSFTVRRLVDLPTGFTSGSVRGTIRLPGERHGDR